MEKQTFLDINKQMQKIRELLDTLMNGDEFALIKSELDQVCSKLGSGFVVSLSTEAAVSYTEIRKSLTFLRVKLGASDGEPATVYWVSTAPQKYIAHGEMQFVPDDQCPCCWNFWSMKFLGRQCATCGARLGVEVKVLLDTNECPKCREGTVKPDAPCCKQCGFEIEPNLVTWG